MKVLFSSLYIYCQIALFFLYIGLLCCLLQLNPKINCKDWMFELFCKSKVLAVKSNMTRTQNRRCLLEVVLDWRQNITAFTCKIMQQGELIRRLLYYLKEFFKFGAAFLRCHGADSIVEISSLWDYGKGWKACSRSCEALPQISLMDW